MGLQVIMLSEKANLKGLQNCKISSISHYWSDEIAEIKDRLVVFRPWEEERKGGGMEIKD